MHAVNALVTHAGHLKQTSTQKYSEARESSQDYNVNFSNEFHITGQDITYII
jgi:hypothetical protein